jgi:hypothetical protein
MADREKRHNKAFRLTSSVSRLYERCAQLLNIGEVLQSKRLLPRFALATSP